MAGTREPLASLHNYAPTLCAETALTCRNEGIAPTAYPRTGHSARGG
jgi:hypothetical protein